MTKMNPLPSQERLKFLFDYCPESGEFTRKVTTSNRVELGKPNKPNKNSGYITISVDSKPFQVHRLVWMYMTGEDPGYLEVDHRNRNRADNSWSNLRLGTKSQNQQNNGCLGYTYDKSKGKWVAQIQVNKKHKKLGHFDCPLMARLAYEDAKKDMHEWGW